MRKNQTSSESQAGHGLKINKETKKAGCQRKAAAAAQQEASPGITRRLEDVVTELLF